MKNCPVCGGQLFANTFDEGYTCSTCSHEFPDWMVNYGEEVKHEDAAFCPLDEHSCIGLGIGS